MKKVLALILALTMVLSMAACSGSPTTEPESDTTEPAASDTNATDEAKEPSFTLKLAHYATTDHPGGIAAQQFADEIFEKTNGDVVVEVYPNNELGDPAQILEQNILGAVDMSLGTQGSLDKYSKKFATVMLPFVFDSYELAYAVLDGPFYDWVKDELASQGLVYLGSWDYGFRNMTNSVRPINTPDDVKGLKMRTPGEIQLQSTMEALGAEVQSIAFNELYLSLKQGVVDGQENPVSVIYTQKYYETQKYLAITNHVYNSMNLVISQKTWDSMPTEYQEIITEASKNAAATMREMIMSSDEEYIAKLEAEGMEVTRPDTAAFAAAMEPAYQKIAEYCGDPTYIDTFLEMVEQCRAELAA